MLLELLLEGVLGGVFEVLITGWENRSGPRWICLFLGGLLLLFAVGIAVVFGLWYGLAVAVVGLALFLYGL